MSFWGSLFGGQNKTLSDTMSKTGKIADFETGQGQTNTSAGSGFFNSILSGDSSKIAKSLAPEISAGQQQGQQAKKASAEQGSRSGGTAASNANIDTASRGNITNLVGGMQTGAASTLLSSGQSLLGQATGAYGQQADMSQQQMKNWSDSILGLGATGGVGALESFGLGKL